MQPLVEIVVYSTLAAACMPLGGALARIERLRPQWLEREFRHAVIAFGGGILVAAVALVLVPDGMSYMGHPLLGVLVVLAGGLFFFAVERAIGQRRRETPQLSAMLLDYLPETLALGGMFAIGAASAPALAVMIGLQNLPEGFNAYRELKVADGSRPGRAMLVMVALVPLGPVLGVLGWLYMSQHTALLGGIMLFASGGILYLIFQDIAPQSRMRRHWAPSLGAVLGFSLALLGKYVIPG